MTKCKIKTFSGWRHRSTVDCLWHLEEAVGCLPTVAGGREREQVNTTYLMPDKIDLKSESNSIDRATVQDKTFRWTEPTPVPTQTDPLPCSLCPCQPCDYGFHALATATQVLQPTLFCFSSVLGSTGAKQSASLIMERPVP